MAMDKSLNSEGIYYSAKEDDMTKGYAMIVGPPGTPYAGGLFFFRFFLPPAYPFEPPKVEFCTSDGVTRFHPNLYREGKVCLSILGTWAGPAWASTMNITTVLVTLQSLLDTNPITCEPSYANMAVTDPRSVSYSEFIQHRVVQYTLGAYRGLEQHPSTGEATVKGVSLGEFAIVFKEALLEVRPVVFERLREVVSNYKDIIRTYSGLFYSLSGTCDWAAMKVMLTSCQKQPS